MEAIENGAFLDEDGNDSSFKCRYWDSIEVKEVQVSKMKLPQRPGV